MSNRIILASKIVGVAKLYPFDFLSLLAPGETLSAPNVSAVVYNGVDPGPALTFTSPSVSGSIINVIIGAGLIGVVYFVSCTVTTSTAQTLTLSGYLAVVPESI